MTWSGFRPFQRRVLLTLAHLLAVFSFVALAPSSAGAIRPIETGVTVPDIGPAPASNPLAFERIRDAGARWTRVILYWERIAPTSKPSNWDPTNPADSRYDWSQYDRAIKAAVDGGVTPVVSIFSAPKWAERCKADPRYLSGTCNPDPARFAEFAEAAARRYSGDSSSQELGKLPRVRYWKIWNEPNLPYYFSPQFKKGKKVSPQLYRNLLNAGGKAVKKVDPTNLVMTGALGPIGAKGRIAPFDFMRRLFCVKGSVKPLKLRKDPSCSGRPQFDIWAHNPYTTGRPSHKAYARDDASLGDLPEMRRFLDRASRLGTVANGGKRIPLWITEMSWDSKGPDPKGVPMKRLTRWVPEAIYRAWKAGVSHFFWLSLRDWPRPPEGRTTDSGLYFRGATLAQDRPKPILRSFRFPFVSFRKGNGIKVWGRTPDSRSGIVQLSYRKNGSWKRFSQLRAGSNGMFSKLVRTRLGKGKKGFVKAEVIEGRSTGQQSTPFPLKLDKVKYQLPFGS